MISFISSLISPCCFLVFLLLFYCHINFSFLIFALCFYEWDWGEADFIPFYIICFCWMGCYRITFYLNVHFKFSMLCLSRVVVVVVFHKLYLVINQHFLSQGFNQHQKIKFSYAFDYCFFYGCFGCSFDGTCNY